MSSAHKGLRGWNASNRSRHAGRGQGRLKKERGIHSAKKSSRLRQRNKFRLPVRQTGALDAAILAFLNWPWGGECRVVAPLPTDFPEVTVPARETLTTKIMPSAFPNI